MDLDPTWIQWGAGLALTSIAGLVWYEIRRVGKGVHSLRTDVGVMVLRLEQEIREVQRDIAKMQGAHEEASSWREMVLELIRGQK